MKRRNFLALMAGAATLLSPWMRPARAQNPQQTNPAPKPPPAGSPQAAPAAPATAEPVGLVATLEGAATASRAGAKEPVGLAIGQPIFVNDTLATGPDSTLGVTFDDGTTFSLSANARIAVNAFVYQKDTTGNAASINVAAGTAAFVASFVAKIGDMKITTATATLGIRGTTGVVEVPSGGGTGGGEPTVKLYPDANGHVGQIEVFDSQGGRLGALTKGASAFTLRAVPGGRIEVVPFRISREEAARDRAVLQRLRASNKAGRKMTGAARKSRGNPGGPNRPLRPDRPKNGSRPPAGKPRSSQGKPKPPPGKPKSSPRGQ